MNNKFTKITIWIILILLTLALVLPSILPLFGQKTTTITPEQLQQIQSQIQTQNISTQPASSETERKSAENKIIEIQKTAEEELKKSSEEASR